MLKPLCFSDVGCLLSLTGPRLQLAFGCSEFLQALMDEETDERAGHEEGKGRLALKKTANLKPLMKHVGHKQNRIKPPTTVTTEERRDHRS